VVEYPTVTVTLPAEIKSALDDVARREGISVNDLVVEAIEEYLFCRRFRLLRDRMILRAQAQGIRTEQDVFDRLS
jgi:predicted transcriptional regulator